MTFGILRQDNISMCLRLPFAGELFFEGINSKKFKEENEGLKMQIKILHFRNSQQNNEVKQNSNNYDEVICREIMIILRLVKSISQISSVDLKFDIIIKYYSKTSKLKTMRFFENLKEAIKMGDFFNSFQMLRYQKQTEYRTFTGGIISMGIVITIVVAFASMILDTINRTTINYTSTANRQTDPQLSSIKASSKNNFMFGVQVWGYNLSSDYRYFDVVFEQIESNYGQNYTHISYPLQPCTIQHWEMLPTVVEQFDRLNVGNWLCPSIDTIIEVQGKYSSQFYKQYSVTLYPCNNNTDPLRPCAPQQEIDEYIKSNGLWNYFTYYYVNSIINPQQPDYIEYYLEDRQWIIFGSEMGAELDMYLTEIQITSDNSIWPFTDFTADTVYYIDLNSKYLPLLLTNSSCYATFFVMKDPILLTYNRQVQKIFVVFSFMGGLIGAVMAGLFIITSYTSFSYEIALARQIFRDTKNTTTHKTLKSEAKGSINMFQFVKYYIFRLAKLLKIKFDWPFIQYIDQCRGQILNQLDIKGLIKRIIFLEYSISYMLEDFHLSEMQNEMTYHLSDVQYLREKFQSEYGGSQSNDSSNADTNKELENGSSILQRASTNQHIRGRNVNAVVPIEPIQDEKIYIENIDGNSEPRFEGSLNEKIKKRQLNFKKLTLSAKEGNLISKKLLDVIVSRKAGQESSREIESTRFTLKPIVGKK